MDEYHMARVWDIQQGTKRILGGDTSEQGGVAISPDSRTSVPASETANTTNGGMR